MTTKSMQQRTNSVESRRGVTFDRQTQFNSSRNKEIQSRYPETSSSDDDEEEEERALSERFGEAGETSSNKRKSEDDDGDAGETLVIKRSRPTLTPTHLMGTKGLLRVRNEFPSQLKYRVPTNNTKGRDLLAAASYGRLLVGAYRNFCHNLFPGLAFEDTLTRIESFGGKKEVKAYVQNMRDDVRKDHLEKIYGKERAGKMLQELEYGLRLQASSTSEYDDENENGALRRSYDNNEHDEPQQGNAPNTSPVSAPTPAVNRYARNRTISRSTPENNPTIASGTEDEEMEATFDDIQGKSSSELEIVQQQGVDEEDIDHSVGEMNEESSNEIEKADKNNSTPTVLNESNSSTLDEGATGEVETTIDARIGENDEDNFEAELAEMNDCGSEKNVNHEDCSKDKESDDSKNETCDEMTSTSKTSEELDTICTETAEINTTVSQSAQNQENKPQSSPDRNKGENECLTLVPTPSDREIEASQDEEEELIFDATQTQNDIAEDDETATIVPTMTNWTQDQTQNNMSQDESLVVDNSQGNFSQESTNHVNESIDGNGLSMDY
eukprot:CAMPEP_0198289340 /NCGR_PEP_ID=MMETSP1449-20131203/7553_1 /TAXON_ID=420275 /ORGANISM="Attheya septentrionalis, Strain CCMP2084" /LENGTH=554 /DNA_ID=CAMNT_0043987649 /DNA_START=80 /DNA_END=1744 /DNA_ORIENTATION=-